MYNYFKMLQILIGAALGTYRFVVTRVCFGGGFQYNLTLMVICKLGVYNRGPGSSLGKATGYGLDGPGSNLGLDGCEIFCTRQDRPWGQPTPLCDLGGLL
jgi:hypothetical protein